ncbi:porin [Marinobacterium rhizophilum]|uniref:porin n=1 Tax=Marinobacterium rhizophilum TaxID=420402 RepID=UPI0003741652|nr:porin [Marinobacterium rhizophilum]
MRNLLVSKKRKADSAAKALRIPGRFSGERTALASALILALASSQVAAVGLQKGPQEAGLGIELGLGVHAGFSSVDYSDSSNSNPDKENVNSDLSYYYTASTTIDPTYVFDTTNHGGFQWKLHTAIQLDDAWLDDDQIDELAIELKSDRYGNFYLGEDDGAADRMKPKQSGRVGIAVGHGAFTGIIPWWGNLPFAGGTIREGGNPYNWDWPNGIVGGDWRSSSRDTQDAIKIGYETPNWNGFTFGASINLQDTYAGFDGPGTIPDEQDSWSDLGLKDDEYELAMQWNGKTAAGYALSAGLIHTSVHVVNDDMLQESTDAGFKVGKQLESGATVSGSVYYAYEDYNNDKADIHVDDQQVHVGFDWAKGKWKVGVNYTKAWDPYNPAGTFLLAGGDNEGYSIGANYNLAKGLTLGGGVLYAENDRGEEATEVGLNLSYRYKTFIH